LVVLPPQFLILCAEAAEPYPDVKGYCNGEDVIGTFLEAPQG